MSEPPRGTSGPSAESGAVPPGTEFEDGSGFEPDPDPDAEAGELSSANGVRAGDEPGTQPLRAAEGGVPVSGPDVAADGDDPDALGADASDGVVASEGTPAAGAEEPPVTTGRHRGSRSGPAKRAPWWELPALIILAVLIAVVVKTFVVQPFYIPSASMEHTLHGAPDGGDRILVNKMIYDFRDPHPGDIVVFDAPPGWNEISTSPPSNPVLHGIHWFGQLVGFVPPDGEVLVKRVIATGGETVWGDKDGRVHVRTAAGHEKVLNEPYVYESGPDTRQTFGPVTVPKGRLWVMGDHRSDSQDSRYHCGTDGGDDPQFGHSCDPTGSTVPVDNVVGKAFVVAWPPSHWRTLGTPPTFNGLAAAADHVVPTASGALVLLPFWFARRRRRRR